jgi:hypothetical protein
MLEPWLSIVNTPFTPRPTTACAVSTPGCPAAPSTRGSVPAAARPIGIGHARTPNAAPNGSSGAGGRRLTAPSPREDGPLPEEEGAR